jgi:hypothetical protein
MSESIRVLVFKEGELWVAQGLERDICVQAKTLEDLQANFEVAVRLEADEQGGLERIPEAPKYFQEMWDRRAGTFSPLANNDDHIEYGMAA